ncbi:ephrin type-A receptor 4a-like [Dendronephthya gigantea]|uniref:ephrin type-A receptor 4a-like n=1 Tax=Dendronephthya gigantea TaxID=151771 RepID=UPI001068D957|nr:ephrin type-A receptor 4a-like [Dendronephthya gigantea]
MPNSLRYDVACDNQCELEFSPGKNNLSKTEVEISGLIIGRYYNFKVYSKNEISVIYGGLNAVANKTFKINKRHSSRDEFVLKTEYKLLAAFTTLLILALMIAIVCILRRKRHNHRHSKCDFEDNGIELPEAGHKMYIDPMNYVDTETALKEFANEIDIASLALERHIGGGEFGDVYKGTLTLKDERTILVAAKTLKPNSSEKSHQDFFMEASAMGQFNDPNVIHLEGVITKAVPKMIVVEYMINGSLDNFLKKNDGGFTAIQLFSMASDVASGMKYLAEINFVHRDLAARNILVGENMICKVADFGLSRELETTDSSQGEYFTQGGKIPVRWTAPEAIKYRTFSTASDVWSFGILLWEIMSSAQRPYWNWDNFKVMQRVEEGFRLPSPVNCPQAVHGLMLKCWEKERSLRPRFRNILVTINEWIETPEVLHQPATKPDTNNYVQATCKESKRTVEEWLDDIKMSSYVPHFIAAGYENVADLAGLLDNDLKTMGISLVGHRNKMLRTIRSLPITEEKNV